MVCWTEVSKLKRQKETQKAWRQKGYGRLESNLHASSETVPESHFWCSSSLKRYASSLHYVHERLEQHFRETAPLRHFCWASIGIELLRDCLFNTFSFSVPTRRRSSSLKGSTTSLNEDAYGTTFVELIKRSGTHLGVIGNYRILEHHRCNRIKQVHI
jgi:hypothetical protein